MRLPPYLPITTRQHVAPVWLLSVSGAVLLLLGHLSFMPETVLHTVNVILPPFV